MEMVQTGVQGMIPIILVLLGGLAIGLSYWTGKYNGIIGGKK